MNPLPPYLPRFVRRWAMNILDRARGLWEGEE